MDDFKDFLIRELERIRAEKALHLPSPTIRTFEARGVAFEMVKVEGGTFAMGADDGDSEADDDEKPAHRVTLSTFWIGRTQVTQRLWKAVMGSNPSYFVGDDLPVESVSWDDCWTFIDKLHELTGAAFRLPSEAEWEYAARGGCQSLGYKFSGGDDIDHVAWYGGNSGKNTHPVGLKAANELGLYDMTGNVWEWCRDLLICYDLSSQDASGRLASEMRRVIRGGAWDKADVKYYRLSFRLSNKPFRWNPIIGLRLSMNE